MKIDQKTIKEYSKSKYLELLPVFKEKKTQKLTTLLLTLAAFSFFGFFAISPTISTIAQLRKELDDDRFVNSKLEAKIESLSALQRKYNLLKEDFVNLSYALPETPKVTFLTAQIQTIAQDTNVQLLRFQVSEIELTKTLFPSVLPDDDPNNYSSFAFSAAVTGSYENILNFLSSVSTFDRIVTFDNLSTSKGEENNFQVNIRGKTYFKR